MIAELLADRLDDCWPSPSVPRNRAVPRTLLNWALHFLPHHFRAAPSRMHHDIAADLDTLRTRRKGRVVYIAPRGSAKSTLATLAGVLKDSLEGAELYTLILSETDDLACELLAVVREELEENVALAEAYPGAAGRGPRWNQHELRLKNGTFIRAMGAGRQVRGRKSRATRPTKIIVDDPQRTKTARSDKDRERLWDWMTREVVPAGDPDCNVIVVGTPVHPQSIVWRLKSQPGWEHRHYRSIERYPDAAGLELWARWQGILSDFTKPDPAGRGRAFYDAHRAVMDGGAELLWPEWKTLHDLMLSRELLGPDVFASEEQCEPSDPKLILFPGEYFDWPGFWFANYPADVKLRVAYLDPAVGRNARKGDYSAFVLMAFDTHGGLWAEAVLIRFPAPRLAELGADLMRDFAAEAFGVEAVTFQELLAANLRPEFARRNLVTRVVEDYTQVAGDVRIMRLATPLNRKQIRFRNTPGTKLLVDQLRTFPTGEHDDGPVALEGAWRLGMHLGGIR